MSNPHSSTSVPDFHLLPHSEPKFAVPVFVGAVFRFKDDILGEEYAFVGRGKVVRITPISRNVVEILGEPLLPHRFVTREEWAWLFCLSTYPDRAGRGSADHPYPTGSVFRLEPVGRACGNENEYVELPGNGGVLRFSSTLHTGPDESLVETGPGMHNSTPSADAPPHRVVTDNERMVFKALLPESVYITQTTPGDSAHSVKVNDVLKGCTFSKVVRGNKRIITVTGRINDREVELYGGLDGGNHGRGSRWKPSTTVCPVLVTARKEPFEALLGADMGLDMGSVALGIGAMKYPNGRPAAPAPEGLCDGPTPPPAPPGNRPVPSRPGWRAEWDARTNRWYFVNKKTNETVWEIPEPREPSKEEMFDFLLEHYSDGGVRRGGPLRIETIKSSMATLGLL